MMISVCIPCMNRAYDLKQTLPSNIEAANASSPVEIVILDYNSQDGLEEYINNTRETISLADGNLLTYAKYTGRSYYHMAHARNLSVLASSGEYINISNADVFFAEDYFKIIRELLLSRKPVWIKPPQRHLGILICQRQEFIDAGGFDERFEFYGPEDKDLILRLQRRGGKFVSCPSKIISQIRTPNSEKVKNYRLALSKQEMSKLMKPIYEENVRNRVMVANEGVEWGAA